MNQQNKPIGIIDIGSNSIRFVAFQFPYRKQRPFINEKTQCGLGVELEQTGVLSEKGKDCVYRTLQAYKELSKQHDLTKVFIIGTAALRDAEDGASFVESIRHDLGMHIDVISGEEEARLSGLGVLGNFENAKGVAGDLGGGSLELVTLGHDNVHKTHTMPTGVLRMMDHDDPRKTLDSHFAELDSSFFNEDTFYSIGGTWRALATAHAATFGNPGADGSGLNGYRIDTQELIDFAKDIKHLDSELILQKFSLEQRRSQLLPTSAFIMAYVLESLSPKQVIVSLAGLRHGLLSDMLRKEKLAA